MDAEQYEEAIYFARKIDWETVWDKSTKYALTLRLCSNSSLLAYVLHTIILITSSKAPKVTTPFIFRVSKTIWT